MRLDSSGRLGLGTSAPSELLTVGGAAANIGIFNSTLGSLASPSSSKINFYGYSQTTNGNVASISAINTQQNTFGGVLQFATNTASGVHTTALIIDSSQRVGIGTTSPAQLLHLNSASANATQWIAAGTGYTSNLSLLANGSGGGLLLSSATDGSASITNSLNSHLTFGTNNTERARIDSSGSLLVGTSSVPAPATDYRSVVAKNGPEGGAIYLSRNLNSNQILAAGYPLGAITGGSNDGIAAKIAVIADAAGSATSLAGRLVFSTTADGAASPTERMRITRTGAILLGCTSAPNPGAASTSNGWAINGTGATAYVTAKRDDNPIGYFRRDGTDGELFVFYKGNATVGNISVTASATAYNTSSDYRLKENVVPLTGAIDRVSQLQVHRFNFIADPSKTVDGFLAHEAQAVVPECVTGTKDEVDEDGNPVYQGIDQSKLVPLLTAALQEALTRIEQLETKVAALESA